MLTADHGGSGKDHGDAMLAADYTIPFLVYGAGVAHGADLYALNTVTRADPGTTNPDYNASLQPIRSGDAANLADMLLGLGPVPGLTIDVHQDLNVHAAVSVAPRSEASSKSGSH